MPEKPVVSQARLKAAAVADAVIDALFNPAQTAVIVDREYLREMLETTYGLAIVEVEIELTGKIRLSDGTFNKVSTDGTINKVSK